MFRRSQVKTYVAEYQRVVTSSLQERRTIEDWVQAHGSADRLARRKMGFLPPDVHLAGFQIATDWLATRAGLDAERLREQIFDTAWKAEFAREVRDARREIAYMVQSGDWSESPTETVAVCIAYAVSSANAGSRPLSWAEAFMEPRVTRFINAYADEVAAEGAGLTKRDVLEALNRTRVDPNRFLHMITMHKHQRREQWEQAPTSGTGLGHAEDAQPA